MPTSFINKFFFMKQGVFVSVLYIIFHSCFCSTKLYIKNIQMNEYLHIKTFNRMTVICTPQEVNWKHVETGRRLRFTTINIHLSIMSPSFCKFNFLSWIESKMAACWLHDFQSSKRYLKRWFVAYIDVDIQRRNIWFADQIIIFRKKKKQ